MAKTRDIIDALLIADPSGNMEVIIKHEDFTYLLSAETETSTLQDENILSYDKDCVILSTLF